MISESENHGSFGVLSVDMGFRFLRVCVPSLADETDKSISNEAKHEPTLAALWK